MMTGEHQALPNIYTVGRNDQGKEVLGAFCRCGWRHFTALDTSTLGEDDAYLRQRFNEHKEA
jgi:hypothetical protein